MPRYRALIIGESTSGLARDSVVNTVYFEDHGATTNAQNLATDLATGIAGVTNLWHGCNKIRTKFYDMAEPEPREVQGEAFVTHGAGTPGPREVCICLSFYAARNLPRQRGRIFLGPIYAVQITERPSTSIITSAQAVATVLKNLGGVDVDWSVYSPTIHALSGVEAAFQPVSTAWVDDEWDTMRSRGLRASSRTSVAIGE